MESRGGLDDLNSRNDSFNQQTTKSPHLNLMITPSVHDFPHRGGKIKKGDFDNYLVDGGSDSKQFGFVFNREPLRKHASKGDGNLLKPPGSSFAEACSPSVTKEPGSCIDDKQTLRSKSNTARIGIEPSIGNNCGPIPKASQSNVGRSSSFVPNQLQNLASNIRCAVTTPKSALGSRVLSSQAYASTGKFGSRVLFSPSPAIADPNSSKTVQGLQEQIQKLQKQLHQKEAECTRDKALWEQKSDLADRALEDMRRKVESQKQQYIQMIKLNNSDSPMRASQNLYSVSTKDSKVDLNDEEVQVEIERKAKAKAEKMLQEKLYDFEQIQKESLESQTKLLKESYEFKLSEKAQQIKQLQNQLEIMKNQLSEQKSSYEYIEAENKSTKALATTQKELYEDANARNKCLIDQQTYNNKKIEELNEQIKKLQIEWAKEKQQLVDQIENEVLNRQKQDDDLREQLEKAKRERDCLRKRWQEVLDKETVNSAVQTDGQKLDQEMEIQNQSIQQMLIEKEKEIEIYLLKIEQEKDHFNSEMQKKDEVILCLTRELRINQNLHESLDIKGNTDKAEHMSYKSNRESDKNTDVSAGPGKGRNDSQDARSQRSRGGNRRHGSGIPQSRGNSNGGNREKLVNNQPEVLIDEMDNLSRKDSMVSFKDSTVSRAFVAQSKKSLVMEPPSFSQDIVAQQVTALQQKQVFGKMSDDMKKYFQPESAGLPQLRKLGSQEDEIHRQLAIYQQLLLNVPQGKESQAIKHSLERLGTSGHFLSQNFNESSNYREVHAESHNDSSFQNPLTKINCNQNEQTTDNSNHQKSQEPIEISSSYLCESEEQKNKCIEIDVPICETSQNDDSYCKQDNRDLDSSDSSQRRDGQLIEGYYKQLQILEQKVATRCQLLNTKTAAFEQQSDDKIDEQNDNKEQNDELQETQDKPTTPKQKDQIIPIDTTTKNDDCFQYSDSADVNKNKCHDLTNKQIDLTGRAIAIQQQIDVVNNIPANSNSIVLSEGFGSSDYQSNLMKDEKSDFTRMIPNEMTVYTRSQVDTTSNLPLSTVLPVASHNDSMHFHQNFPYSSNAIQMKDCAISEVTLSHNNTNTSVNNPRHINRLQNPINQLQDDMSLLALIKEIHLDESSMSHQNFLHNNELLDKCKQQIENQKCIGYQQFGERERQMTLVPSKKMNLQRYDTGDHEESNEQIYDEFTDQSGQDTIAKEHIEDQTEDDIVSEDNAQQLNENKDKIQKGYVFTFKKQSMNLLEVPNQQQTLSDLKETYEFPDQFTSENVEQTNESIEYDEPQIKTSSYQASSCVADSRDECYNLNPSSPTKRNNSRLTPRETSKHRLNDTIEPRITVDKANINLPRKSPFKNKFPEPISGKNSDNGRYARGAYSSLGMGNNNQAINSARQVPQPQSQQYQRQLLFKGKNHQGKTGTKKQSFSKAVMNSQIMPSTKQSENVPIQKLQKKQSKGKLNDSKQSSSHTTVPSGPYATARSINNNQDKQMKVNRFKQRTPSMATPILDSQSVMTYHSQKQTGIATQRNHSNCRSDQQNKVGSITERLKSQKGSEGGRRFSGKRNQESVKDLQTNKHKHKVSDPTRESLYGKLISDLRKDVQVMEKLTKVHSMNNQSVRKSWNTSSKQAANISHQASQGQLHQAQQNNQAASNCLLQRRKDFRDAKVGGFRKFDLDSLDQAVETNTKKRY